MHLNTCHCGLFIMLILLQSCDSSVRMTWSAPLLLMILCYCCVIEGALWCPSSCQCRVYAVNCSKSLQSMPNALDSATLELDLSNNNLTDLEPQVFRGLKKLQDINVSFNNFVFLPVDIFSNTNLYTLNISHCKLDSLNPKTLRNLSYLFKLDIGSNRIARFHVETFAGNFELTYLDVSNNRLNEINYKTFHYNTKLSTLDLSRNELSYIHPQTFSMQRNLRVLNLSQNLIASLDKDLFHNMSHLMKFDASSNLITHIQPDTFKLTSQLFEFRMKNNKLKDIDSRTFRHNVRLSIIDLSGNRIEALKDGTFFGNPSLTEVNLSGNVIATIFVNAFPAGSNIQRVDLSNNRISVIHPDVFVRIPLKHLSLTYNPLRILKCGLPFLRAFHLETLDLEHCNITHLPSSMFSNMVTLKELKLANNRIGRITTNVFEDLQALLTLDLSRNLLKVMQKKLFENLGTLRVLNVSHNPLKCDSCFTQEFLLWSLNISTVIVNTTCKVTSLDPESLNCSSKVTDEEKENFDLSKATPNKVALLGSEVLLENQEENQKVISSPEDKHVGITTEPTAAATQDISVVLYIFLAICSLLILSITTFFCILIRKGRCCR